jgi:hypothetical protein
MLVQTTSDGGVRDMHLNFFNIITNDGSKYVATIFYINT